MFSKRNKPSAAVERPKVGPQPDGSMITDTGHGYVQEWRDGRRELWPYPAEPTPVDPLAVDSLEVPADLEPYYPREQTTQEVAWLARETARRGRLTAADLDKLRHHYRLAVARQAKTREATVQQRRAERAAELEALRTCPVCGSQTMRIETSTDAPPQPLPRPFPIGGFMDTPTGRVFVPPERDPQVDPPPVHRLRTIAPDQHVQIPGPRGGVIVACDACRWEIVEQLRAALATESVSNAPTRAVAVAGVVSRLTGTLEPAPTPGVH